MNAAAIKHLRAALATAERELESASFACRRASDEADRYPTSWANVASHATQAALAAGAVSALHDALIAAGQPS